MTREEADYSDWGQIEEKSENVIDVLNKIKAEIDKIYEREGNSFDCLNALDELRWFIDEYKAEREGKE